MAAALVCAGIGSWGSTVRAQRATTTRATTTSAAPSTTPPVATPASPPPAAAPASEAPADPHVVEARAHFDQGAVFFERENYEAALAEFDRAYELLQGNPNQFTVLYNIGQTHERLFQYDAALTAYREYLERGGEQADDRVAVQATMRALDSLLSTIHVVTNVARADVWLDDRRIGNAPGELRIPGGRHVLQLRAPGYLPNQVEVQIVARARRDVIVNLTRIPTTHGLSPILFGTAAGIAVVAAAVGGGFGISALIQSGQAQAQLNDSVDRLRAQTLTQEQRDIGQAALTADILYASAAGFAVIAGVLFVFTDFRGHPSSAAPPAHAAITPMLTPGLAGLSLQGAF